MDRAEAARVPLSPGLGRGGNAWRAGRAAVTLAAVLDARWAADDGLSALAVLGTPEEGWWAVLGQIRQARSLELRLPRPGDPRGLPLPRHLSAEAALGWPCRDGGSRWLIPVPGNEWLAAGVPHAPTATFDPAEAARTLRSEVVRAAHVMDLATVMDLAPSERGADATRMGIERDVDSWILGPPALPAERRALASTSLRILLAITRAVIPRSHIDADHLERAARAGVEAAYSSTVASG